MRLKFTRARVARFFLLIGAVSLINGSAHAQFFIGRSGWPSYRMRHDLTGQSYSDIGPGGRTGYYTPMFLPGIDDFNGPSRAYTPIFNAPQAAPEGATWLGRDRDVTPAPRKKTGGPIRRLFSRR
jgi:hypothetical protein